MDTKVFMTIAMAIISIAGALVSAYVIPWIKTNVSAKDLETITFWVRFAVRCADQLFTPEQWEQKKEYVMQYIIDKCNELGLKLSEVDINTLIEAMVNQIHHGGEE
jgi:spore coat protein CotH